ncbi:flagellar hook-basal body complex protein FliE [Acidaminobacter hydrogenoformans]|uniref:Flagellar hook-basal body complex protein FliE n=1 Tax=Acidaminobacter hydrogenoformans DSM 2784 TaxID=1120920 RepID=A0A1G5RV79_9FIRM|nr:flagellar hook-basal body complex protein FliE [Acidaminobacter hydrogenoformans]SCZ77807.1 flagellar hook-basal body complex protein FliE [Acidaminobacter hydrogenoformans DSM 2784]
MKLNPVMTQLMPLNELTQQTQAAAGAPSFGEMLSSQLEKVAESQGKADLMTQQLVSGGSVELHEVLIATQEAKLMLEMTMQVRNKVVEAYKEMMSMQI